MRKLFREKFNNIRREQYSKYEWKDIPRVLIDFNRPNPKH